MIFESPPPADPLREAIRAARRADEAEIVGDYLAGAEMAADSRQRVADTARRLVEEIRRRHVGQGGLDAFLHEYGLSSPEGVILMCLAESLLRIPDAATADKLIRDKLTGADWERHLGRSESIFVNASTWALMLTGRVVDLENAGGDDLAAVMGRLVGRSGEPVIRQALLAAMGILGRQFVMGRDIGEALARAREDKAYRYSYDMLGEEALTAADAERYLEAYGEAIAAIGGEAGDRGVVEGPGISVKLSALHPRYEFAQRTRVLAELGPRLLRLAVKCREAGIGMTVDAEESERQDLMLDLVEAVFPEPALEGWEGFGIAVQTYQKCAAQVIEWLAALARRARRRMMLRLVKGAYWDREIKLAQERGLATYPVFTRKASTDVAYLACARRILAEREAFYPQFATHNAHTLAAVIELAGESRDFEFQRLHGMGEALYAQVAGGEGMNLPCRVYAPVGSHKDLLPYLVRRLLENGTNTSFINRIVDLEAPIEEIIADPAAAVAGLESRPHPRIPLPSRLFGEERVNSKGIDLDDPHDLVPLAAAMETAAGEQWTAAPGGAGGGPVHLSGRAMPLADPADNRRVVGHVIEAGDGDIEAALGVAHLAAGDWDATPAETRAACLEKAAEIFEAEAAGFMALLVREAGKTIPDAVSEIREAVDFCRYYAVRARADFAAPETLPGPTGEVNQLSLHGRGVFACVSPWNFPLAIFAGQVTAALAAGNAVIAKPAEQTPLVAAAAVKALHRAGVPQEVLHLMPGGPRVGARLVGDPRISGVAFTGSTETARAIAKSLAGRDGPIVPLIAETGGLNAMIIDSSALPERVVSDAVRSAFNSAGQRCSALRVLFLQEEVASRIIDMITGAMAELNVGDPGLLATDVGPVIDHEARKMLEKHARHMSRAGTPLAAVELPREAGHGSFFAPRAFEIAGLDLLKGEVFGPILHIVRFSSERLDEVIDSVNMSGFGLTFGIQSRIDATVERIRKRLKVGNCYVNRNIIGAVVGVQPFGGEGLSGTGPKAGGARYLDRFAVERTLTVDTTAVGGNVPLLSLDDA